MGKNIPQQQLVKVSIKAIIPKVVAVGSAGNFFVPFILF